MDLSSEKELENGSGGDSELSTPKSLDDKEFHPLSNPKIPRDRRGGFALTIIFSCLFIVLASVIAIAVHVTVIRHRARGHHVQVPQVASAWYTGNHSTGITPSFSLVDVTWELYTELIYAFAITTPDITNISLVDSNPDLLPQFVSMAHGNGVNASVSVGGWTGSQYFSSHVATSVNRSAFVKTITDFAKTYKLDGVNFDWEYPTDKGVGCNIASPNDTTNFLSFLQELRADPVGSSLTLSATASLSPWNGPDGNSLTNVSAFSEVLNYIQIMNYDVWGTWSSAAGPNAPLNDTCAGAPAQQGSAVSAVASWTAAGMPASQIVLGVPSYGHSYSVTPMFAFQNGSGSGILALYPPFNASSEPAGDAWSDPSEIDICGNREGPGGTHEFWDLILSGWLDIQGNPASGIDYIYDDCSETPFIYNETSQILISYDNVKSFRAKGEYLKSAGLRGFAMYEAGGDYDDILLDSIRAGAGF